MKDLQANRRTLGAGVLVLVLAIIVSARISTPAVFMTLIATYVVLGLLEEVLFFRRRRAEEIASAHYEPEDDEGEVLAELGASTTRPVPSAESLEAAEVDVGAR